MIPLNALKEMGQNIPIIQVIDDRLMLPTPAGKHPFRLWLAISGHGHGHLVQVSPLIAALRTRYPTLVLSVQSSLPEALLKQSFGHDVQIHSEVADFGMVMSGPMKVLPAESLAAYQRFHDAWEENLAAQVFLFHDFRPDLVIGDIPYLPLAAAKVCGVPSVAVCSLNWADILEHYCSAIEGADGIVGAIRRHYDAADLFLRPTPSMPMATLGNTASIGPLIAVGRPRRAALLQRLSLPRSKRLVLLTLGGIDGQIDISRWPHFDSTVFLAPAVWLANASEPVDPEGFASIESTELPMADLFASCDALVTKPGYGAFTGAGCAGLPVLFSERGDWPEEPYLRAWLKQVGRAASIGWTELAEGTFARSLDALIAQPPKPPAEASGAADGLELIAGLFGGKITA